MGCLFTVVTDKPQPKLNAYYDLSLDVSALTPAKLDAYHEDRLMAIVDVAHAALTIPRRIGRDATPTQLAADQKASRFVAHFCSDLAERWRPKTTRRRGYAFTDDFLNAHKSWLTAGDWALGKLSRYKQEVATLAIEGDEKLWGNRRLYLLEQETRYWVKTKETIE